MSGAVPTTKPDAKVETVSCDAEDLWQYQFAEFFEDGAGAQGGKIVHTSGAASVHAGEDVGPDGAGAEAADAESDGDRHLKLLDKARKQAAEMREALSPAAFGLFNDLERQLDAEARAQLAGTGRCLVHVSEPAEGGEAAKPVPAAVDVLLQTCAPPRSDDHARAWTSLTTFTSGRKSSVQGDILDTVSGLFLLNRVVAVREDESSDGSLRDLSDIELQVRPFDAAMLSAALAHGFRSTLVDTLSEADHGAELRPEVDVTLRRETERSATAVADRLAANFDLARLTPSQIDFACGKAATLGEAEALLSRALAGRATAAGAVDRSMTPTLDELPGYEGVRSWAEALVSDVQDYAAGTLSWSDVDVGAVLTGPPGTGKTLLAGAIARSAGCAFVATSFAEWLTHDGGHLGSVVAAMRKSFAEATQKRPCLLFIDEFDSLPARGASGRHDDYWRPIVNALLELLDGDQRREGLVVLAACNDASCIDPALLRSGRLDRTVAVGLPTARDLAEILLHMVPELGFGDAERLAAVLAGSTTGADVARLAREARGRARREGRPVTPADITGVALPPDTRSQAVRRRVAIHEAGHAISYVLAGRMPAVISVDPGHQVGAGGWVAVPREYGGEGRRLELELAELVPLLCGRAAEDVILGDASSGAGGPASSDLARATQLAAVMIGRFGLGASLVYTDDVDRHAVDAIIARTYAQAQMLMLRHRASVIRLSDRLLRERILTSAQLQSFGAAEGLLPGVTTDD